MLQLLLLINSALFFYCFPTKFFFFFFFAFVADIGVCCTLLASYTQVVNGSFFVCVLFEALLYYWYLSTMHDVLVLVLLILIC